MGDPAIHHVGAIEPNTHAFVVKVWCENDAGARRTIWRGHITHVASGRRRYITSIGQLDMFIIQYLNTLPVHLPLFWRIYQWLAR